MAVTQRTPPEEKTRLDKWLWAARFFKTRALAAEAIDGGKVDVNGEHAKRARLIGVGDRIEIRRPPFTHAITVLGVDDMRGSASIAATLYAESDASRTARDILAAQLKALGPAMFRDKGKPSKQDRRNIDRARGRGD